MVNLDDKIAIVTGAGHGIGKGIALAMARSGADVVVTDLSDEIFNVGKEIESIGSIAFPVKCDVTNIKEAQTIEKEIVNLIKFSFLASLIIARILKVSNI